MKKRTVCFILVALFATFLTVSVLAAETPQISVTWLTGEGKPYQYNEGLGWLTLEVDDNSYYVIDLETQEQISGFDCVEPFHEGLARAARKDSEGGWRYGYLDKNGEPVIPLIYTWGSYFREGMAAIERGGKCGYIDKSGDVVIPAEWDVATWFNEGLAYVGRKIANDKMKYGYIDQKGALKCPLEWDSASTFCNGMARVGKTDAEGYVISGYIDTTGALKIPCEFQFAANFSEGLASVIKDGKYGYIDRAGNMVFQVKSENCCGANPLHNGKAYIWEKNEEGKYKASAIDKTGNVLESWGYEKKYNMQAFFGNENSLVLVNKKDDQGNTKWGVVNLEEEVIIPLEFDDVSWFFSNGIIAFAKKNADGDVKWGYMGETGEIVLPFEYDEIGFLDGNEYDAVSESCGHSRLRWVKKGNSYGYFIVPEEKKPGIGQVVADLIGQGKDNKDATPVLSANTSTEAAKTGKGIPAVAAGVAGTIVIVIGVIFVIKRKTPRK